ncbi:tetratricopeptide repeat protein [Streptomyces sp. NPDC048659]|uniref:tetratricopeptide repeat protein n=1 Tax=Streptomyces sp. NPDC048659 TaxID=3155489 RepID=UPI00343AD16B
MGGDVMVDGTTDGTAGGRTGATAGGSSPGTPDEIEAAARAAFEQGVQDRTAGWVNGAREAFRRAARTGHPDIGPMALANLAVLEAQDGRAAAAREAFERAIATGHPDHAPQSLFNYAVFEQRSGDPAHARELYRRALDSGHPEHARKALLNLGGLAADEGAADEACELWLRAMEPPFRGDTAHRAHRRLVELAPDRLPEAREVYLRAMADGDELTAGQARTLLHDLDPGFLLPGEPVRLGSRSFDPAEIESAEWATGRRPAYSSGHLDVYTRDGALHTVFVDLGDPYDRRGYEALRRLLGPAGL